MNMLPVIFNVLCWIASCIAFGNNNNNNNNNYNNSLTISKEDLEAILKASRLEDRKYYDEKLKASRLYYDEKLKASRDKDRVYFDKKFGGLFNLIKTRYHNILSEYAEVLGSSTMPLNCKIPGDAGQQSNYFSTEHLIIYNNYVFTVGAKHSPCYNHINIYMCSDIDVVFRLGCPMTLTALNISQYVPLRTGDEASTLGYINKVSRFWNGQLSGRLGSYYTILNATFLPDEYIFQGVAQISGMSGGAVLNGIGYTGMVHGTNSFFHDSISTAIVLPSSYIFSCFDAMETNIKSKYFKKLEDCPNVKAVMIPKI